MNSSEYWEELIVDYINNTLHVDGLWLVSVLKINIDPLFLFIYFFKVLLLIFGSETLNLIFWMHFRDIIIFSWHFNQKQKYFLKASYGCGIFLTRFQESRAVQCKRHGLLLRRT